VRITLVLAVASGLLIQNQALGSPTDSRTELLARSQELLDAGDAAAALEILDRQVKKKPASAEAFLMRSTALFMIGELDQGRRDLDRALKIDPELRQAWLNRAALDLSDGKYGEALAALEAARDLDPSAPDNDLNLGAVHLLQGNLQQATAYFRSYLGENSASSEAFYLVATNYAMAGYAGPAIEQLRRAIEINEKSRLRARTDPNFRELESNARYQQLLNTDIYQAPPGSYRRLLRVETPFEGTDSLLLKAVLDALQFSNQPFDRRVEVTDDWALIWGEMRIKLSTAEDGKGSILLTAAADQYTPAQWQQQTDDLVREITVRLTSRGR
jgi:tetratricopeptide (TPR) repeat protein